MEDEALRNKGQAVCETSQCGRVSMDVKLAVMMCGKSSAWCTKVLGRRCRLKSGEGPGQSLQCLQYVTKLREIQEACATIPRLNITATVSGAPTVVSLSEYEGPVKQLFSTIDAFLEAVSFDGMYLSYYC